MNPDLERLLELYYGLEVWRDPELLNKSTDEFNQLKETIEKSYDIIEFLNEVEEQDWELDSDDIKHILKLDFDYIRKQYES